MSEPLGRRDPATNNVAEIKAVIRALQIAKECGILPVTIQPSIQFLFLIVFFFARLWACQNHNRFHVFNRLHDKLHLQVAG